MNQYNNYDNLEHITGKVWITKHEPNQNKWQGLNLCVLIGDDFKVVSYIRENGGDYYIGETKMPLDEVVQRCIEANGWKLEDWINF